MKTDPTNYTVTIDGRVYTLKRNKRIKWAEFWTLLRDGKPFSTLEYTERDGWRGTFTTKDWRGGALWGMSDNVSLEDRVFKQHQAHKEAMARLVII